MRGSLWLAALGFVLSLTLMAVRATFPSGEFVTELNTELFESDITGRPDTGFYLVEFYSPTCGHCKAFGPVYEEVGNSLRSIIPVGRLSVHDYADLTAIYKVKSVPHVALFLPGATPPVVYQEDRTAKEIVEWVLGAMAEFETPLKEIKEDGVEAFINSNKRITHSRYLMINAGTSPVTWGLIHKRIGNRAIAAHLDSNLIGDQKGFKAKYNISRFPAVVAHLKPKDSAEIRIVSFSDFGMMTEVQKILMEEKAYGKGEQPLEDVDTDGVFDATFKETANSSSFLPDTPVLAGIASFLGFACIGVLWAYKNRNKKVKEVVPVDLTGVSWEVGGKKALD